MKNNKGFTLIELLVVVAIIGVLMAFAIPRYFEAQRQARINTCVGNQKMIISRLATYSAMNRGAYPTEAQYNDPTDWLAANFEVDSAPTCPGGGIYTYTNTGGTLVSITCDGEDGTHIKENVK